MLGRATHPHSPDIRAKRLAFETEATAWGCLSCADVGYGGPWVSPIQMRSGHPDRPVLLAKDYLDAPSLLRLRNRIAPQGYLPDNPFNKVIDAALKVAGLRRKDVYITQCFAAIVPQHCSTNIPAAHMRRSFDCMARHKLAGRHVISLGLLAARLCDSFSIPHNAAPHHPGARGKGLTTDVKATALARLITAAIEGAYNGRI